MLCARGRGGYLCNSIVSHKTVSGHHYHSNRRGRIFTTWKRRSETALFPPVPSRPSSFRLCPPARGSRSSFMSTNPPPPASPKSSFPSPEEQSAACLTRTRYVVFFFSFFSKYSYCHYLFPARFFTSPSSFIPSLTSVLLLVAWLPATGAKQRLGLCKWPRKSFSETARAPFVHLSISLLTGTLASTFSCAVFNRDVHLDENRKGTNGPLNCRRVHTRKKSHTECVFLVKSGNQMSNDPPVTISHFWHQPTYLMLPCFSVHFHQHLIAQN